MARAIAALLIAGCVVSTVACTTTRERGYVICNDLAPNVTCPDNTANVVIGM